MNHKKEEYPLIKVESKNSNYAKILSESYSGVISELTAVHEYIYQHIMLKGINDELSNALLHISMTEMRHVSILGQLIRLLGANPKFSSYNPISNNYISWSSGYVNYEEDIIKLLKHNIKTEEITIRNYKKTLEYIKDKYITTIINKIIEDELMHIEIFEKFL